MNSLSIYLNFNTNTEDAFIFYKSVFGGEFRSLYRFKDFPNETKTETMTEKEQNGIMHIELPVFNQYTLMGTDAPESMGFTLIQGNNMYIMLQVDTKKDADMYFAKLSLGGKVEMPLNDMFWGSYYGSLKDKFGVGWMINCPAKM